jgi:hypothetical protein
VAAKVVRWGRALSFASLLWCCIAAPLQTLVEGWLEGLWARCGTRGGLRQDRGWLLLLLLRGRRGV